MENENNHHHFMNFSSYGSIELKGSDEEFNPNCLLNPNWENSMDQNDPFESALSSIVSSPVASSSTPEQQQQQPVLIRELIGRLGHICNSTEISPSNSSYNVSSYSTPLNSPPNPSALAQFAASDPGFVERTARFSSFGGGLNGHFGSELQTGSQCLNTEIGDCREESSVSEQIPKCQSNGRKRKAIPKGKSKDTHSPSPSSISQTKVSAEKDELKAKRSKSEEAKENEKKKKEEEKSKAVEEAPKDYIHVRARRGQATDSHSLAERVRREKISERMKFLQDLVPGCNKVIGKAVMLDEIINYVQSLQRQVEFLSMKLATVNSRTDMNMEALLLSNTKDILQYRGSLPNSLYPLMESYTSNPPHVDGFPNSVAASSQIPGLWEDDLQSVVQMGFGQNQIQNFHGGSISGGHMKIEL